jgi:DHA2 family multidrug resistance protein-like MFS transporter
MTNTVKTASLVSASDLDRPSTVRAWSRLAVLTLPCLVVAMDAHVLTLTVPALSADLRASGVQLLWITDIYVFLVAGFLIPMGGLADRIGRRRLLLWGALAFAVASATAAWAPSAGWLVAARALQGIAGATLMPSTLALIRDLFPDPPRRTIALSVWGGGFAVGGVVGPVVAGVLLSRYWWGSVLLVAVPIMVAVVVTGSALLPVGVSAGRNEGRSLDVTGAALCLVSVLALVFALKRLTQEGAGPLPGAAGAVGLGAAVLAARHLMTVPEPLVDLQLFRRPAFVVPLVTNACGFFVRYGTGVPVAQYMQLVARLSPLTAGALTIPSSLAFLLGSAIAPLAARHLRVGTLLGAGLATAAVGFAILALAPLAGGLVTIVLGTTARNAFTVAFQITEAAGALLLVLVAIVVLARRRP